MLHKFKALCITFTVLILLSHFSYPVFSQGSHIRFKRLTINDGLSLSSVYCIFQDSKGFMWFGTEDGLNKYDGNNFVIYRADPTGNSGLSYKWTEIILQDSRGKLWLGSRGGLSQFDPETEIFGHYFFDRTNVQSLSNDTITTISEDDTGNIWVGTVAGLTRITIDNQVIERISLSGKAEKPGLSSRIHVLLPGKNGSMWIGSNLGLFYYDQKTGLCQEIQLTPAKSIRVNVASLHISNDEIWAGTNTGIFKYNTIDHSSQHFSIETVQGQILTDLQVEKLHIAKNQVFWAGTSRGLCRFNEAKQTFVLIVDSFDSSNSLSINAVKPLFEDSQGIIWYGTFGSGIYKIEPITSQISHYSYNSADQQSLSENSINCIYEDRAGVIWLGTFGAGISIYDPLAHKFDLIKHDPSNTNSLSSNFIWSVFESGDGNIWIGTNNKGLNCFSPKTNAFKFSDHIAGQSSVASSTVRKVFEDSKGNLWIGTDGGGLDFFIPKTGTFKHFTAVPGNPETLSNNSVRVIFEDKNENLWIGTRDGLNKFEPSKNKFTRYKHAPDNPRSISHNFIYSGIMQDKSGNLWIGTYGGGLNKMDIKNETFIRYQQNPANSGSISDNIVFSVYEDKSGLLWIGTNNGLNRFDPETSVFRKFGLNEGLPNETIYGILPESDDVIWLSTNLGISRFDLRDYSCKNFDVNDGLQSNEFNGGAFHKGRSGKMYFGGVYGLNIVNPEKIKPSANLMEVVFTKFDILGKRVLIAPSDLVGNSQEISPKVIEQNDNYFLPKSISFTSEIKLSYQQRFISFEFAALNCPPSENVNYSYKMENMDENWNFSGTRNYVTYANMKPGNYIFKVTAHNADGQEIKTQAQLAINIAPPIWETWWFIILEMLALAGIAIFIYGYLLKIKTNKLLTSQNLKIQSTNQKLVESEAKLKELNNTKDKFFSIIAHDLKNPFTSLLSISELLSTNFETLDEEDKIAGIQGFHNSAKRIYSLLENLLIWSRAQTGRIKYAPSNFNLSQLAADNINLFLLPAREKGITLHLKVEGDIFAWGDPEMMDLVFRNLLHNAIKYSTSGSEVTIEIVREKSKIKVTVKDQGIGIPANHLNKLFNLASNSTTNGTSGEKGSGLGLIVCKEFVERHGSRIEVQSEVNKGSFFSFFLNSGNN
jgi:ligand-binding sensor domain-containing protein/signal transduction histidine kinase